MPALARLLRDGALGLHSIPSGLPTSTPAFQAGLMYGGPVDVPAFEFLEFGEVIRTQRFTGAVFFAEPFAEIDQLAALRTERPERRRL